MTETAFNVFLWLIILFLVSFVLNNLWRKIFLGKKYRIFLAPGVIVHELSHAVACRLTGAKIKEINFFLWDGGLVISIIICLVPSKTDIKNAFGGVLIIFLLGLIFHYFNFFPQFIEIIFNPYLGNVLVFGVILGFLAIIFILLFFYF